MKGKELVHKVLDYLGRETMDTEERRLLTMSLGPSVSQEELDAFLKDWDIEKVPIHSVILLAYLMKIHPELSFPDSVLPRLKGVLNFCRFQSLKLFSHFSRIAGALNRRNIPFVILKGGAMKVYRPDFPRWMGDVDILVKEKDFHAAETVAEELGYSPFRCSHSTDLRIAGTDESVVDLHRFIQMHTGEERPFNDDLFRRAGKERMFSSDGLLPCREDMVFISLVNLYKNLSERTSAGSVLNSFFDLHYLLGLQGGFDWGIVRENAARTRSEIQVWMAAAFVSSLLPGLFPEGFLSDRIDDRAAEAHCLRLMYKREVLSPMRAEIGEFNLAKAFREIRPLAPYVGRRAKFFFLKRIPGLKAKMKLLRNKGFLVNEE